MIIKIKELITERLEKIVDEYTIEQTIEALAEVCFLKSEHLKTNWQDEYSSELWEKIGNKLNNIK